MTPIEQAAQALRWYEDEAKALAKHMQGGAHTQAVLASLTVLALDAGRRAEAARAALASLEAAKQEPGWKLVPVEPTPEMLRAAIGDGWVEPYTAPRESGVPTECDISKEDADWINAECSKEKAAEYRAVLAAAPSPGSGT